ncbi:unnamed protein product [Nyctereutes procyonoides]|uniref:(raccoon dog) hypothetical protein n=1 Tax=Nyctereutes procyonoides TaxID=34880 RepID=A0A811ZJC6_NYCPR|nr:unnamed protein product [Nyctereutes procyonoides]
MATGKCGLKLPSVCLPKQGWLIDRVAQRELARRPRGGGGGGAGGGAGGNRGEGAGGQGGGARAAAPGAAAPGAGRDPRAVGAEVRWPRVSRVSLRRRNRAVSVLTARRPATLGGVFGSSSNGPLPGRKVCTGAASVLFPLPLSLSGLVW